MAGSPPGRTVYLHGDLDLHIISASNLPNMDIFSERLRLCFSACAGAGTQPSRSRSPHPDLASPPRDRRRDPDPDGDAHRHGKIITSDPYVKVRVPHATIASTRVLHDTQNPMWDQQFHIALAHPVDDLEFHVKDDDILGAQLIGVVKIPAREIAAREFISRSYPLIGPSAKSNSVLQLELKFTPVEKNEDYQNGIAGVRQTYFPLRKGSGVTLYQDAHVVDGWLPDIKLDSDAGGVYRHGKCWEDICHAISEAHHLIYIVGWSVFHKVKLIREPTRTRALPRGGDLTLGDLLKYKSEEGVRVLLLIWDDKTSYNKYFINTAGVMQTHDEETRKFFKHSSVNCVLAPRYASSKLGYIKQQVVGTMFTHHQKCVLVDTQASGNNRKITAFVGGIDLCHGRYDTPEHRLFRDLHTEVFQDDFYNPTYPADMKAPRQPWHDLHCRIEGPAAYDVLINFEQRWRKATRWKEFSLFVKGKKHWHDDSLIKIGRISWILSPPSTESHDGTRSHSKNDPHERFTVVPEDNPNLYVSKEDDPNNWHVQIFRSIDSGSVKGFPTKRKDVTETKNLLVTKDVVVDRSIQTAYIQAIRSAKHFVYIENQYFLGSSYAWPSHNDAGADNLIPMELALKIAGKIRANERFAVYIVIPMWPEGDPRSATVQEILFWQNQTMQMMYQVVASELKQKELKDSHPQDFLNFYCLGKREDNSGQPSSDNEVSESYKSQRFMIYVHAKGMVVDDEYVLLGSANINQRSLAGTKDTEIAMGAYQPHHTWARKQGHPYGQVYGYRMSLWAEHLGQVEGCFVEPGSSECVNRVNEIAEKNRDNYKAGGPLQGHLLRYPIQVDRDGNVGSLQGFEEFPDVGGKVVGTHSNAIPDVLTT
ncbi:phospholipase D delta isoform X2 [Syzygium oleosum]|uniref:phospholipase D delta isoform X2 n=1 Tax=Syzygium oleosum TaxID=219896 RepID=UPI0024B8FA24|nr:phospholipase D delta isoform X2 [Syzygium oleosum]